METLVPDRGERPRALPVVGGHLALDFANTVDDPAGVARWDHLADYDDLLAWSVDAGSLGAGARDELTVGARRHPRRAAAAYRRALDLRTAVNAVFGAIADGGDPSDADWATLRALGGEGLARADLAPAAQAYALRWSDPDDPEVMLWPVVDAALRLLVSPDLARLKRCGGCPWLFLDRSKNGSRRWCAMDDCGTHEKIRRYVSRRAARRSP